MYCQDEDPLEVEHDKQEAATANGPNYCYVYRDLEVFLEDFFS